MIDGINRLAMMSNHADILLVTATAVESSAVLKVAEESTGHQSRSLEVGNGTYRDLGTVNGKKAWLVQSEMGTSGPVGAQETVGRAIREVNPEEIIMVGIAFGSNREKQEIGDVLVARQLHLYEPQRLGTDRVIPRGDKVSASSQLLARFRSAALDWKMGKVHFGLVLSGEKLIDDEGFTQSLLSYEPEAIGGDMEGAGLYSACHAAKKDWILVKAVCDWADGNKREDKAERQAKAADNAASFVWYTLAHATKEPDHQSDLNSPPRDAMPDVTSERAAVASASQRPAIRENSAAEILANLKDTPSYQYYEKSKDLYFERWTREPGWKATVSDLPSKLLGGRWSCSFKEDGSDTVVLAFSTQDLSRLRLGDPVTVSGRISAINVYVVSLEDAIIQGDDFQP